MSRVNIAWCNASCKTGKCRLISSVPRKCPLTTHKMIRCFIAQLSETGLFVDPHHDPDTPSGLEVNTTMYYVLSSFPSPAHDGASTQVHKDEMEKLLHIPDHCFGGPPTMWVWTFCCCHCLLVWLPFFHINNQQTFLKISWYVPGIIFMCFYVSNWLPQLLFLIN